MTDTAIPEPYVLPLETRKSLRVLVVKNAEPETSMAALALHSWRRAFPQGGAGIRADARLALETTRMSDKTFSPMVPWSHGEMTALLFSDQSILVAKTCGDELIALPAIFRPRLETRSFRDPRAVPVIRSQKRPRALLSFRYDKRETSLPAYEIDDPALLTLGAAKEAFEDLEADLRTLSQSFEDLPRLVLPDGAPPALVPGETWVPWLPQRWFSAEEEARLGSWCQDLCDWIFLQMPETTKSVSMDIRPYLVSQRNTPIRLQFPFMIHLGMHKARSQFWSAHLFFEDPGRFVPPVTAERLLILDFAREDRRAHTAVHPSTACGRTSSPPSRHRELQLRARFGRCLMPTQ